LKHQAEHRHAIQEGDACAKMAKDTQESAVMAL